MTPDLGSCHVFGKEAEGCWPSALPISGLRSFIIWNGGMHAASQHLSPLHPAPGEELSLHPALLDHEGSENLTESTGHCPDILAFEPDGVALRRRTAVYMWE